MGAFAKAFSVGAQLGINLNLIERNQDTVIVGGAYELAATASLGTGVGGRFWLNKNNLTRIRQNGNITHVAFYTHVLTNITSFYFQIWRKNGLVYDLVGEENVLSKIAAATINNIALDVPITAQDGDYCCLSVTNTEDISGLFQGLNVTTADSSMFYDDSVRPSGNAFDWDSKTPFGWVVPIKTYMQAPLIVTIGDSIIGGANLNTSFIENSLEFSISNQIANQLSQINPKYVYQNMGIGSQTTTQIKARFIADVVDLKPKIALINGGVNDISGGIITKAIFLSNYTSILGDCTSNGIIPIICKILPWTNGSNAQMTTRDEWSTDLLALIRTTYPSTIYVDFDVYLGQFREGGTAGNLWDLKPEYNDDGVHPTLVGYAKMAEVIDIEIKKRYRF